MSGPALEAGLRNLAAWSAQVAVLAGVAAALSRLLPIERPQARLAFGQGLLVLVLALPLVQPWQSSAAAVGWSIAPLGSAMTTSGGGATPSLPTPGWYTLVAGLLLLGFSVQLARLVAGLARIRSLRHRSRALVAAPWLAALRDELAPRARFFVSDETATPATCGWRRPIVLLPTAFDSMDRDRQRAIAAHELFHARRGDWLPLILEEALKAALFFHPAVHWLVGRVRLAREQAVDAAVVERLGARDVYLESLVEAARFGLRARAVPAAPFLRESHLRERVDLLLKEVRMSRVRTHVNVGVTAAAVLLAVAWAVSAAPLRSAPAVAPDRTIDAARFASSEPIDDKTVSEPKLVHKVNPVYPEDAKADKVEGMFLLAVVVGKDGAVHDVRVVASSATPGKIDDAGLKGDPRLAKAAVEAVQGWRYEPILENGQPVEMKMTITIVFRLS